MCWNFLTCNLYNWRWKQLRWFFMSEHLQNAYAWLSQISLTDNNRRNKITELEFQPNYLVLFAQNHEHEISSLYRRWSVREGTGTMTGRMLLFMYQQLFQLHLQITTHNQWVHLNDDIHTHTDTLTHRHTHTHIHKCYNLVPSNKLHASLFTPRGHSTSWPVGQQAVQLISREPLLSRERHMVRRTVTS